MAQFFTDFAGNTVGTTPPTGWTARWDATDGWDVVTGPYAGYQTTTFVAQFDFLSWDTVGSVSGDTEILVLCRSTSTAGTQLGVVLRGSSSATDGYAFGVHGSEVVISILTAGSEDFGSPPAFTFAADTDYWIRAQVTGSTIRMRVWADGGSEPGTWTHSRTDSSFSSGYVGLFARYANGTKTFKQVGVGTNGDAAPSAPVSGGGGGDTLVVVGNPQRNRRTSGRRM